MAFQTCIEVSQADSLLVYIRHYWALLYIHFLYGSEEKASELLNFINKSKDWWYIHSEGIDKHLGIITVMIKSIKLIDNMLVFIKDSIDVVR